MGLFCLFSKKNDNVLQGIEKIGSIREHCSLVVIGYKHQTQTFFFFFFFCFPEIGDLNFRKVNQQNGY